MTVPSAAKPKIRIQRRFSVRQVQTARMIVSSPAPCAIMRWVCSNFTPPTSFGILYKEPNEVGQSGTDSPASLLVTSAPAMIEKKSPAGKNDREPVMPAIVGCRDGFQSRAPWVRESPELETTLGLGGQGRQQQ